MFGGKKINLVRCGNCGHYFHIENVDYIAYYKMDGVDCPNCHLKTKSGDGTREFIYCKVCENAFGIPNDISIEEREIRLNESICLICRKKSPQGL